MPADRKPSDASGPIRLLVSACLLGENVRYDGGRKYDRYVVETLGKFVEWVRVCPESDAGMPTPRPPMHLAGDPEAPRLVSSAGEDLTDQMRNFIERRLDELEDVGLCGYICKKGSPSSGMERVEVYDEKGLARWYRAGLFTGAFMARFPLVPVEDEDRLNDPAVRESFVERIFNRRRELDMSRGGGSRRLPERY